MIPKSLSVAIVCLVTVVWLANFAAQFLVASYQVDGWVHAIFLSVVGGALAFSRKGGPDGGSGGQSPVATLFSQLGGTPPPPPAPPAENGTPETPPRPGGEHRAPWTPTPSRWRTAT